jgi:hypothetical protein
MKYHSVAHVKEILREGTHENWGRASAYHHIDILKVREYYFAIRDVSGLFNCSWSLLTVACAAAGDVSG